MGLTWNTFNGRSYWTLLIPSADTNSLIPSKCGIKVKKATRLEGEGYHQEKCRAFWAGRNETSNICLVILRRKEERGQCPAQWPWSQVPAPLHWRQDIVRGKQICFQKPNNLLWWCKTSVNMSMTSNKHSVEQKPPKKPALSCRADLPVSPGEDYVLMIHFLEAGIVECHWILRGALEELVWFRKWVGSRVRNTAQHTVETVTGEGRGAASQQQERVWWAREPETEALLSAFDVGKGFANHWVFFYTGVRDRPFVGFNFWAPQVLLWCFIN